MAIEKENKITKETLEAYKAELLQLTTVGRDETAKRIAEAKSYGDLSENAEYDAAMNDQAKMEDRIRNLQYFVNYSTIIDESGLSVDSVKTGLYVKVLDRTFDEECVFHIVGSADVKPLEDEENISEHSPVGKALLGHTVGQVITIETPGGNDELEILEIFKK